MSRLPIINSKKFEKLLLSIGFRAVRQKGSHIFYKHNDGRYTTLPHHKYDLSRPLIHEILREINITTEEFIENLNEL